jgi:hypothetical protein
VPADRATDVASHSEGTVAGGARNIIVRNLDEPSDARRYSPGMTFVAMVGDRNLAYESHRAIEATVALLTNDVDIRWVPTDDPDFQRTVENADAVWALPGTPYVNDAAAHNAITRARTTGQPFNAHGWPRTARARTNPTEITRAQWWPRGRGA